MTQLTVAVGQMDIVLGDGPANLRTAAALAERAAAAGAELLLLPELWASGYMLERATELGAALDTGLFAQTAELARQHQIAICGSLLERTAAGCFNTATFYDAQGRRQGVYRKIHLIGLMDEGRYLRAGTAPALATTPWGPAGLTICYDLRFPELYRSLAVAGAELMLVPAEWPVPRIEHWRTLLRARAIENQCFVVACNRVGSDRANAFGGRSAVIAPSGAVLAEAGDDPELLLATLDLAEAGQARAFLPVLSDRRPDVY